VAFALESNLMAPRTSWMATSVRLEVI
jgi:hypothetical protein